MGPPQPCRALALAMPWPVPSGAAQSQLWSLCCLCLEYACACCLCVLSLHSLPLSLCLAFATCTTCTGRTWAPLRACLRLPPLRPRARCPRCVPSACLLACFALPSGSHHRRPCWPAAGLIAYFFRRFFREPPPAPASTCRPGGRARAPHGARPAAERPNSAPAFRRGPIAGGPEMRDCSALWLAYGLFLCGAAGRALRRARR